MAGDTCAERGTRPGKYFVIHLGSGQPVRVCSSCGKQLAKRIAAKETKAVEGPGGQLRLRMVASVDNGAKHFVA